MTKQVQQPRRGGPDNFDGTPRYPEGQCNTRAIKGTCPKCGKDAKLNPYSGLCEKCDFE